MTIEELPKMNMVADYQLVDWIFQILIISESSIGLSWKEKAIIISKSSKSIDLKLQYSIVYILQQEHLSLKTETDKRYVKESLKILDHAILLELQSFIFFIKSSQVSKSMQYLQNAKDKHLPCNNGQCICVESYLLAR